MKEGYFTSLRTQRGSCSSRSLKNWLFVLLIYLSGLSVGYGQRRIYTCANDSIPPAHIDALSSIPPGLVSQPNSKQLQAALEDTTTYTIPVVFIIYHKGEPVGTGSNIADSVVQYILDLINERFSGIGVNGYRGQDSKIRFTYARRTQACKPTTGILRVDGRSVPGYEANGLNNYTIQAQLAALVPDFIDQSVRSGVLVINIYHNVSGGAFAYYGGAVHMTAPNQYDLNPYNYVPPHEVGHSLQLYHPYYGSFQTGNGYSCPVDTYNDYVEDTQPTRQLDPYAACDPNADQFINSCTGVAFGTQLRNLMTYGCNQDRYTPGQIARMRYYLANDYKSLSTSEMDKPLNPTVAPIAVTCALSTPSAVTTTMFGITTFQFNTFDSQAGIWSSRYSDYTCAYKTKAEVGQTLPMSVTGYGTFGRVYIDYNADGSFDEASELVMAFSTPNSTDRLTFSQSVTIPSTAVLNRILRVRVVFDNGDVPPTACIIPGRANQGFGEVEDYGLLVTASSCESIRSGSWHEATTWSCGHEPRVTEVVTIHSGHTVTISTPSAQTQRLIYNGGGIKFADATARLFIQNAN